MFLQAITALIIHRISCCTNQLKEDNSLLKQAYKMKMYHVFLVWSAKTIHRLYSRLKYLVFFGRTTRAPQHRRNNHWSQNLPLCTCFICTQRAASQSQRLLRADTLNTFQNEMLNRQQECSQQVFTLSTGVCVCVKLWLALNETVCFVYTSKWDRWRNMKMTRSSLQSEAEAWWTLQDWPLHRDCNNTESW